MGSTSEEKNSLLCWGFPENRQGMRLESEQGLIHRNYPHVEELQECSSLEN